MHRPCMRLGVSKQSIGMNAAAYKHLAGVATETCRDHHTPWLGFSWRPLSQQLKGKTPRYEMDPLL